MIIPIKPATVLWSLFNHPFLYLRGRWIEDAAAAELRNMSPEAAAPRCMRVNRKGGKSEIEQTTGSASDLHWIYKTPPRTAKSQSWRGWEQGEEPVADRTSAASSVLVHWCRSQALPVQVTQGGLAKKR